MNTIETPRVYVACLASYNAGILYGEWVDIPETVDELQEQIKTILSKSTQPFADEWAFHDHDGFNGFDIAEYEDLESLIIKANVLNSLESYEIEAFSAWADNNRYNIDKMDSDEILEQFREDYLGTYESEEDYAEQMLSECYEIPDYLQNYIDYKAFWRDLSHDGYYSHYISYKEVAIFRNN